MRRGPTAPGWRRCGVQRRGVGLQRLRRGFAACWSPWRTPAVQVRPGPGPGVPQQCAMGQRHQGGDGVHCSGAATLMACRPALCSRGAALERGTGPQARHAPCTCMQESWRGGHGQGVLVLPAGAHHGATRTPACPSSLGARSSPLRPARAPGHGRAAGSGTPGRRGGVHTVSGRAAGGGRNGTARVHTAFPMRGQRAAGTGRVIGGPLGGPGRCGGAGAGGGRRSLVGSPTRRAVRVSSVWLWAGTGGERAPRPHTTLPCMCQAGAWGGGLLLQRLYLGRRSLVWGGWVGGGPTPARGAPCVTCVALCGHGRCTWGLQDCIACPAGAGAR
jgi:hypothetical protein